MLYYNTNYACKSTLQCTPWDKKMDLLHMHLQTCCKNEISCSANVVTTVFALNLCTYGHRTLFSQSKFCICNISGKVANVRKSIFSSCAKCYI